MMTGHDREIQQNYLFFQSVVGTLVAKHCGEFALIHKKQIVGLYPIAMDAVAEGHKRFAENPFSVQRVLDHPLDLGFLSYVSNDEQAVSR
jgi:hypothetical protein